ncbi:MAG TPA: hypothetical protein VF057_00485 [Thermoanaerobaculia bacterium]
MRVNLRGLLRDLSPHCDGVDFSRGNLDNNIGFRAGREWDVWRTRRLSLVAGGEAAFSQTEYNLSQTDFVVASGTALLGGDLHFGPVAIGGRGGVGPFATSDGREYGFHKTLSAHITLPLTRGSRIRIARTSTVFVSERPVEVYDGGGFLLQSSIFVKGAPRAHETSFLLVTSPDYTGSSNWEYSSTTGTTNPGGPLGSSRKLRVSNFNQLTAARQLPWKGWEGRVTWIAAAHESTQPTVFYGYDNNFRSKTIQGVGLAVRRSSPLAFDRLSIHYGGGVEVADWSDEHHLLSREGETINAALEWAVTAQAAVRWHLTANLALETAYEKAYWRNIDLGENRLGISLVITSFSSAAGSSRR